MLNVLGVPAALIFVGALIGAVGAIWASIEQSKSEKELRQKSEEIALLNKQISQLITGGDSFSYLDPISLMGGVFPESLMLHHEGDYPIYDVGFRIVDLDDFEDEIKKTPDKRNVLSVGINQAVGNLSPRSSLTTGLIISERPYVRLMIQLHARNGHFVQNIRIKQVGGGYKIAMQVSKSDENGKAAIIFERVDDGFPLDKNGKINWVN